MEGDKDGERDGGGGQGRQARCERGRDQICFACACAIMSNKSAFCTQPAGIRHKTRARSDARIRS
jgi:hypothetical protein